MIVLQLAPVMRTASKSLKLVPTASSPKADKRHWPQWFLYKPSGSSALPQVAVFSYLAFPATATPVNLVHPVQSTTNIVCAPRS